jgi:hypothetical protein
MDVKEKFDLGPTQLVTHPEVGAAGRSGGPARFHPGRHWLVRTKRSSAQRRPTRKFYLGKHRAADHVDDGTHWFCFVAVRAVSHRLLLGRVAILKEKSARRLRTPVKWPRVRANSHLATLSLTSGIRPNYNSV